MFRRFRCQYCFVGLAVTACLDRIIRRRILSVSKTRVSRLFLPGEGMEVWRNSAIWAICLVLATATAVAAQTGPNEDTGAALLSAVERGDCKMVVELLDSGSNVDTRRKGEGSTPLIVACAKGHIEVAKVLLDKGADVNARNVNGWTALMAASANDRLDAVKLLLDRGAEVNSRHAYGHTALKLARQKNHTRIVKLLLQRGAKQ